MPTPQSHTGHFPGDPLFYAEGPQAWNGGVLLSPCPALICTYGTTCKSSWQDFLFWGVWGWMPLMLNVVGSPGAALPRNPGCVLPLTKLGSSMVPVLAGKLPDDTPAPHSHLLVSNPPG